MGHRVWVGPCAVGQDTGHPSSYTDNPWRCEEHRTTWSSVELCGVPWSSVGLHGVLWGSMGLMWVAMGHQGWVGPSAVGQDMGHLSSYKANPWRCEEHRTTWSSVELRGVPWVSVGLHGAPWGSMGLTHGYGALEVGGP